NAGLDKGRNNPYSCFNINSLKLPSPDRKHLSILRRYSADEQRKILKKLELLQGIARLISQDFNMPILLNDPGAGWHWNYVENKVRVDPEDLLSKSDNYLKFVIAHEAVHRKITRFTRIPQELISEPGYSFMSNAIEDPRINNFLISAYPYFESFTAQVYSSALLSEKVREKAQETLGYTPRFVRAGLEYIRLWAEEVLKGKYDGKADSFLPKDVQDVVNNTADWARLSWSYYPLWYESEQDSFINGYQDASIAINAEKIWPEFKKLIDKDLEDQKLQELMREIFDEIFDYYNPHDEHTQELRRRLPDELFKELMEAIKRAPSNEEGDIAIPLDQLSEELKEKLREYFDSLSEAEKKQLEEAAKRALKEFEKQMYEELKKGLAVDAPPTGMPSSLFSAPSASIDTPFSSSLQAPTPPRTGIPDKYSEEILEAKLENPKRYRQLKKQMQPVIFKLTNELKRIFNRKKKNAWQTQFKLGKKINIRKRLQEVAKNKPAPESRAWQRRAAPLERDYAITLLVDLTGSMNGDKLKNAVKGVATIAEALRELDINIEILGFNRVLTVYKGFKEPFNEETEKKLSGMELEVRSANSGNTDDGWAVHLASERQKKVSASKKFIIVITDGQSNPSPAHAHPYFNTEVVLKRIKKTTNQQVIGVGLGEGTDFVSTTYPVGISNVEEKDLVSQL
ncbi:MAG: VWA domain-containing protein, partial [Candidatus Dadabacteria bacterium]